MQAYNPDSVLIMNGEHTIMPCRETSYSRRIHSSVATEITPHSTTMTTRRFSVRSAEHLLSVEIELLKTSPQIRILEELCETPLNKDAIDLLTVSLSLKNPPKFKIPNWIKPIIRWKD